MTRRRRGRTWTPKARLVVILVALTLCASARVEASEHPRVYIVLVDGLDASVPSAELTPTLWKLTHDPAERATFYPRAHAVLPSVTNTNHVSVLTGTYPAAHGIVGNTLPTRTVDVAPVASELARFVEVETLFTVIERERPSLTTAALFGKSRLVGLFTELPKRQRAPDVLWGDAATESEPIDPRGQFASDQRTMDETVRTVVTRDPDFMFVALPDVDRTAHVFGPDSPQARRAVLEADRQIGRLIDLAKRRDTWTHTVLMVTADHGFQSVKPEPALRNFYPVVSFGRELTRAGLTDLLPTSNGGMEFLALAGSPPKTLDHQQAERLREARALALQQPEIEEACYRLPNAADGGDTFTCGARHPAWRLDHPRAGELVLVTRPHHTFADPFAPRVLGLAGDHGGPGQSTIPVIIAGGDARVRAHIVDADDPAIASAANPDLGATAAWLLGVRMPRTITGGAVPKAYLGRILREAFF